MRPVRRAWAAVAVAAVIGLLASCAPAGSPGGTSPSACPTAAPTGDEAAAIVKDAATAVVQTNKGSFTIELYGDKAPIATANFVALARCRFYEGVTFHRVIAGFVAQAGDPQTKTNRNDFAGLGTGGPGYHFEIEPPDQGLGYDRYVVAMANAGGIDTNGSQFFIDLADLNDRLDRSYTIFGRVVDGTSTVDTIGRVPTSGGERDVPLDPVVIDTITIRPPSS